MRHSKYIILQNTRVTPEQPQIVYVDRPTSQILKTHAACLITKTMHLPAKYKKNTDCGDAFTIHDVVTVKQSLNVSFLKPSM